MKPGLTAIIATLFRPPTLGPLVDALDRQGVEVLVIEGKRTNVAWQEGLDRAETRFVMILNDDIEVRPADFVARIMAHHRRGFTHVLPTMWRGMNIVSPDGNGGSYGPGWNQGSRLRTEAEPMDKGHFISMDRIVTVPRIPDDLTVFYGDDWFYHWHKKRGRTCLVSDVQVLSGGDLDAEGFAGLSGYTQNRPGIETILGESLQAIAEREHARAPHYFDFYSDEPVGKYGWFGFSRGLREESPKVAAQHMPIETKDGVDAEMLLADLYASEPGSIMAVREALSRFMAYDGPLDHVLDIGANYGAVAIAAALRGAKHVVAVEADPANAAMLRDHVARYKLSDRIEVIEKAVTKVSGERVPWLAKGTSGQRSCVFGPFGEQAGAVDTIAFIALLREPVDYVKIDVEGAEYLFLVDDLHTRGALANIGFLDLELHGHTHELFLNGPLSDTTERVTWDLLTSIGLPPQGWVARGRPQVLVGA